MYSYEERLRAVKLYIKLGKRVQASIRELGYPTKNTLKQAAVVGHLLFRTLQRGGFEQVDVGASVHLSLYDLDPIDLPFGLPFRPRFR